MTSIRATELFKTALARARHLREQHPDDWREHFLDELAKLVPFDDEQLVSLLSQEIAAKEGHRETHRDAEWDGIFLTQPIPLDREVGGRDDEIPEGAILDRIPEPRYLDNWTGSMPAADLRCAIWCAVCAAIYSNVTGTFLAEALR